MGNRLSKIKNSNGPKIDPCRTPAFTFAHDEKWPFKTTLCWWFFKKSIKRHSLSFIPFCFNLYINLLCHTLSKALDMSRNTPLTSKPLSKVIVFDIFLSPFLKIVTIFHFFCHPEIFHILSNFWIFWKEVSSRGKLVGPGQKPSNKQPKFINLLILVHLKNYFIEVLNKFLMYFKINGLKNFKLTT